MRSDDHALIGKAVDAIVGRTVGELRARSGISTEAKDFHVRAIHAALLGSPQGEAARSVIERNSLKVARIDPAGQPAEAMSFPATDPFELVADEWESSRLRAILDDLLIIGLRDDEAAPDDRDRSTVLGWIPAVPHVDAWGLIEAEWRETRGLVEAGGLADLRREAESRCIFLKRKSQGGEGVVAGPAGQESPPQAFWLTKGFLRESFVDAGWVDPSEGWSISRPRVFVATAYAAEARAHYLTSVAHPVDLEALGGEIRDEQACRRATARASDGTVRLWGAKPGDRNTDLWGRLQPGDWVFFYWDGNYTAVTRVLARPLDPEPSLAKELWGEDPNDASTWELVYFLDGPREISVGAEGVSDLLPGSNRGFRAVKDESLAGLASRYGSVEEVVRAVVKRDGAGSDTDDAYFILLQKTPEDSAYADAEGNRYTFDSSVTGRVPLIEANGGRFVYYRPRRGADAATSQSFFGAGTIANVESTGSEDGVERFVATLEDYEPFDRSVPASDYAPPGWNRQHSIAQISREAYEEILRRANGEPAEEHDFDWLEHQTLWTADRLHEIIDTLTGPSPQVILAGPPGTGKTWVAEALGWHLSHHRPRTVEFHPSYGYEEFIEGLRPSLDDSGGIRFDRVDGKVLEFVNEIRGTEGWHVLVIDEMNRANLPRVFGELMYLFEYRDEPIDLQYSTGFSLPRNALFIGTMNTADRSIRSIDVALRRRFDVFECPPDAGILERFYADRDNQVPDLIEGFEALNDRLTQDIDRHHTIGHTFFMTDPRSRRAFTKRRLRDVWTRKIFPLIEEYFFDQPNAAASYSIDVFWPSALSDEEAEETDVDVQPATSAAARARHAFFEQTLPEIRRLDPSITRRIIPYRSFMRVAYRRNGRYGVDFATGGRLRAGLYLDTRDAQSTRELYERLYEKRETYESQFGGPLSWEPLEERRASRVCAYRPAPDLDNRDQVEAAVRWAADSVIRIIRILDPVVAASES